MVLGEPGRAWIAVRSLQTKRSRLADQHAENASSAGQVTDGGMRLGVDSRRHKGLEPHARTVDDSERCVARTRETRGGLDECLEQGIQRELGAQHDSGIDENAQAIESGLLGHRLWILGGSAIRPVGRSSPQARSGGAPMHESRADAILGR